MMSKTIKFVNEKIRETERSIRTWKMMLKNRPNDEAIAKCLNIREKELQEFQQIKCELKVWESVKSHLVDLGDVYVLAICNNDKEYLTLKKVLENYNEN